MMNGTVIGPVVTPPASNASAQKLLSTKHSASTNTSGYSTASMILKEIPKTILSIAAVRKMPTPAATERIKSIGLMPSTCAARICKSGSATVTITPITKLTNAISQIFLLSVSFAPAFLPISSMEESAPSVNSPMPRTSSRTPAQNDKKIPDSTGATVAAKIATISATGNTEDKLSLNFSLSACNIRKASLRFGEPIEWNKGKDGADFFDMPFFCNICCGSCHVGRDLKDKFSSVCFADSFPDRGSRVAEAEF